jgi:hypothetical protein
MLTTRLLQEKAVKVVGSAVRCVDVVKDVINLVPVHWIANEIVSIYSLPVVLDIHHHPHRLACRSKLRITHVVYTESMSYIITLQISPSEFRFSVVHAAINYHAATCY